MLQLDSLVIDLIFQADAEIDPEKLVAALGGREVAATRKILDPDLQDPRFEMELSPSMPFRRRGERRLMIIDDTVAPMRKDPQTEWKVPLDLRPEMERLIKVCEAAPVRLGRLSALGAWGDAVMVARSARDLRGAALILWALDPLVDIDGRKRARQLGQQEFEQKILAYDKRLDELDDPQILASLGKARLARRGELLVVDVLEDDGTWDVRKSMELERSLAAVDRFARIPGARLTGTQAEPPPPAAAPRAGATGTTAKKAEPARKAEAAKPAPAPEPVKEVGPPLRVTQVDGRVVLVFPRERFDLDAAAAMGKKDWNAVIRSVDKVPGQVRDQVQRDGAGFVAPLEFLSEVFVDGQPLSRARFEADARPVAEGVRAMEVHFPRFGPVILLDVAGRGRFVSSELEAAAQVARLVAEG